MKSKYDTLFSVVNYVKNESENSVTELLLMGFTPCQLVYEFGFNETEVRKSPVFLISKILQKKNWMKRSILFCLIVLVHLMLP